MKSLIKYINEALGDVSPKTFMDIWKGKNPSIDVETANNAAYFSNELLNVHRDKLPTSHEFVTVCKWIIKNTNWTSDDVEVFLGKMLETYLSTNCILHKTEFISKIDTYVDIPYTVDFMKNEKAVMCLGEVFFRVHSKKYKQHSDVIERYKQYVEEHDIFTTAFKKYKVSWLTWPDYSEGMDLLFKAFA